MGGREKKICSKLIKGESSIFFSSGKRIKSCSERAPASILLYPAYLCILITTLLIFILFAQLWWVWFSYLHSTVKALLYQAGCRTFFHMQLRCPSCQADISSGSEGEVKNLCKIWRPPPPPPPPPQHFQVQNIHQKFSFSCILLLLLLLLLLPRDWQQAKS